MTELVMALGIVLGVAYHEVVGLSPGGVIAPAYLAIFFDQPGRIIGTAATSIMTYLLVRALVAPLMLYGRRKYGVTLLLGFLLRWTWDLAAAAVGAAGGAAYGFQAIGFIVPGLIAHDIDRQGVVRTWASLLIVAATLRLALLALQGLRGL